MIANVNKVNPLNIFHQQSDLHFPVVERPLQAKLRNDSVMPISSHKALLRPGPNNEPIQLGVVGKNYSAVDNKTLFRAIEAGFCNVLPGDALKGVQTMDHMARGGALCYREYVFPNMKCKVGKSDIGFRAIVVNAFDGSSPIKLMTGAIDFFCTNGMVLGDLDVFGRKHTGNLQEMLERGGNNIFTRQIERTVEKYWDQTEYLQKMREIGFPCDHAFEFLKDLPGMSERKAQKLHLRVQVEREDRGDNLWSVYSAMTFYASHPEHPDFKIRDTGNDNKDEIMLQRENEVRQWINSQHFKERMIA